MQRQPQFGRILFENIQQREIAVLVSLLEDALEIADRLMIVQHQTPQELYTRCMDYFERLYAESAQRVKIMSIAVHPYISGTPFRIKYFERVLDELKKKPGVVFWTGEQIMEWYRSTQRK